VKRLHEVPLHRAFTKPDEKISIYKTGKFQDFCRGPHLPSTGKIKAFKLLNIAGATGWRREESAIATHLRHFILLEEGSRFYLTGIEEAKKRDHRVLGKQLDCSRFRNLPDPA